MCVCVCVCVCVLDILSYPEARMDPSWLGQEKNVQEVGSQKSGKRYFMINFCKYSKSADVRIVCSPQTPQKLLDFDIAVTHFP